MTSTPKPLALITLILDLPAWAGPTPLIEPKKNITVEMATLVKQEYGKANTDKNQTNSDLAIAISK